MTKYHLAICWWVCFISKRVDAVEDEKRRQIYRYLLLGAIILYVLIMACLFILYYPILTGIEIPVEQAAYLKELLGLK